MTRVHGKVTENIIQIHLQTYAGLHGIYIKLFSCLLCGSAVTLTKNNQKYTVSQKKQDTRLLAITSLTIIRFSQFFSLADSVVNLQQIYV